MFVGGLFAGWFKKNYCFGVFRRTSALEFCLLWSVYGANTLKRAWGLILALTLVSRLPAERGKAKTKYMYCATENVVVVRVGAATT